MEALIKNEESYKSDEIFITFITCLLLLMFLITFGNLLVLFTVYRNSSLAKKPIYIFTASLALVDFTTGLIGIPSLVIGKMKLLEQNSCSAFYFVPVVVLVTMSLSNLLLMTADRLFAIRFPLRYMVWMTAGRAVKLCCIVNVVGFVVGSASNMVSFCAVVLLDSNYTSMCDRYLEMYRIHGFLIFAYLNVNMTILSVVVMLFCYSYIFVRARRHMKERASRTGTDKQINTFDLKATKTTVTIVITFIICLLPKGIQEYINESPDQACFMNNWPCLIVDLLILSNSMLNPFIYSRNKTVRKLYKQSLTVIISKFKINKPGINQAQ
ncbi:adenosine receptor A2a-like [Antedon mediterranea]|uniref:adenosine receptor A2a-like n=1 Tax=Antedon mediterranea TaxID=105859 RepID=UPI003AF4221B